VQLRAAVEALLHLLRTAMPWRLPPHDFPNRSTVQRYLYAWQTARVWETINFLLLQQARERAGREASPSAGLIDSHRPAAALPQPPMPVSQCQRLRPMIAPQKLPST
jgi:transposase